jgi:hypothetical protein
LLCLLSCLVLSLRSWFAAALAQRMQLPQTACLALSGPLEVPETGGGRAWFNAFNDDWELIQVGVCTLAVYLFVQLCDKAAS